MRLPPLNAVRMFEAAARLLSFKSAAAELNVTAGAVSKQIKLLEDHLGVALFERRAQSTTLTAAGSTYFDAIGPALAAIASASAATQAVESKSSLHVWCSPFVMRRWLVPRLPAFRALRPQLEIIIDIVAGKGAVPVNGDIGIQRGDGRWSGLREQLLFPIRLVPVCSPGYLEGRPPPKTFTGLRDHVILENLARPDEWPIWSSAAGGSGLPAPAAMSFNSSDTVLQAALEGMGVAIGRLGFIEQQISEGRLVIASETIAETNDGYYLVTPSHRPLAGHARAFQRWLLRQAQ